jgi:hypothetical protein
MQSQLLRIIAVSAKFPLEKFNGQNVLTVIPSHFLRISNLFGIRVLTNTIAVSSSTRLAIRVCWPPEVRSKMYWAGGVLMSRLVSPNLINGKVLYLQLYFLHYVSYRHYYIWQSSIYLPVKSFSTCTQ